MEYNYKVGDRVICLDPIEMDCIYGDHGTIIEVPEEYDGTVLVEWDEYNYKGNHSWWAVIDDLELDE